MAGRAIWKGSISFGLVNIPVSLSSASREHELKFTLLHKKDLSQIRYARICKSEDKEIPWKDIVKGFEYKKGEYVVMEESDFEKANLKKTRTIDIIHFTDEEEIESIYYTKPYYLEPEKGAGTAYSLLSEALKKSKKVGIAKYVFHNREHLAVIKPYGNTLALIQLRHYDEIIQPKEVEKTKEKMSSKEVEVALQLINHLTEHFEPQKYPDTYAKEIKEIIEQKAHGKKIKAKGKEPAPTKVHDIMSLLKASLDQSEAPKKTKKKRATA